MNKYIPSPIDLSKFDLSSVRNMYQLFAGASNLESINFWDNDFKNVTNMNRLFNWCSKLTGLDLSNWNTNQVKIKSCVFNIRNYK